MMNFRPETAAERLALDVAVELLIGRPCMLYIPQYLRGAMRLCSDKPSRLPGLPTNCQYWHIHT